MIRKFMVFILVFVSVMGCKEKTAEKSELLIYCGITMRKPMEEIAKIIETNENVKINFMIGGTGNLLDAAKASRKGDLFLPGSDSYIKTLVSEGLISADDTVDVGYNYASIVVAKGNPLGISGLDDLLKDNIRVIIADADSGSIGKNAKKILDSEGIYDQIVAKAVSLTTDSKDIINSIRMDQADAGINWYATSFWDENKNDIDAVDIDGVSKAKLVLCKMSTTSNDDVSSKFLEYASSPDGLGIFKKYGF